MSIDPRLDEIDDCLYRVAVRALVMQDNKILLVKEFDSGKWWAVPGGGVDHGETMRSSLLREIEEELGVSAADVTCDSQIANYNIGRVVSGVPRMNVFFRVSLPTKQIKKTEHVEKWAWFNKSEFLNAEMNASYDKDELARVIFTSQ